VSCCVLQEARLEGETLVLSADAVIVGSGAGGGVTAALLAEAGAKVQQSSLPASPTLHIPRYLVRLCENLML
jgi:hypothetical protein